MKTAVYSGTIGKGPLKNGVPTMTLSLVEPITIAWQTKDGKLHEETHNKISLTAREMTSISSQTKEGTPCPQDKERLEMAISVLNGFKL